jgi:hypothetical protein
MGGFSREILHALCFSQIKGICLKGFEINQVAVAAAVAVAVADLDRYCYCRCN